VGGAVSADPKSFGQGYRRGDARKTRGTIQKLEERSWNKRGDPKARSTTLKFEGRPEDLGTRVVQVCLKETRDLRGWLFRAVDPSCQRAALLSVSGESLCWFCSVFSFTYEHRLWSKTFQSMTRSGRSVTTTTNTWRRCTRRMRSTAGSPPDSTAPLSSFPSSCSGSTRGQVTCRLRLF